MSFLPMYEHYSALFPGIVGSWTGPSSTLWIFRTISLNTLLQVCSGAWEETRGGGGCSRNHRCFSSGAYGQSPELLAQCIPAASMHATDPFLMQTRARKHCWKPTWQKHLLLVKPYFAGNYSAVFLILVHHTCWQSWSRNLSYSVRAWQKLTCAHSALTQSAPSSFLAHVLFCMHQLMDVGRALLLPHPNVWTNTIFCLRHRKQQNIGVPAKESKIFCSILCVAWSCTRLFSWPQTRSNHMNEMHRSRFD